MTNEKIPDIFDSKIKKLRIELPEYHFSHSLSEESYFVGRKKILEKLKSLIKDNANKTGVYLVTGNRGVGKTSFVNKAINETQKVDKQLLPLYINFGHNLTEKDILRLIVYELNTKFREKKDNKKIIQQLKYLNDDITNSTERERGMTIDGSGAFKFFGIGVDANTGTERKMKKSRGVADAREIEMRLLKILKEAKEKFNIVIVFDELDKVEQSEISNTKASLFSISATRERQFEILKILSNMKYFLSTAEAKFIFIAGREMYDIYLADVSERSNYIGSIFNAVIYVPSFLTDKADNVHSDITSLTEEFVCKKLMPKNYQEEFKEEPCNLKSYRKYLEDKIYEKKFEKCTIKEGSRLVKFIFS